MVTDDAPTTISSDDLDSVLGGFSLGSLANIPFGQIGQSIGGVIDAFKSHSAAQIGGSIGGLFQQFMGLFGGGGGGSAASAQQQGPAQQSQAQGNPQMGG